MIGLVYNKRGVGGLIQKDFARIVTYLLSKALKIVVCLIDHIFLKWCMYMP